MERDAWIDPYAHMHIHESKDTAEWPVQTEAHTRTHAHTHTHTQGRLSGLFTEFRTQKKI